MTTPLLVLVFFSMLMLGVIKGIYKLNFTNSNE